jgi:hypothetical protein
MPEPVSTAAVAARLLDWVRRLLPDPDRVDRLAVALEAFDRRGEPVSAASCREIERACRTVSRHVDVQFEPDGTGPADTESRGWPAVPAAEVRARCGGVGAVHRVGGAVVVRIDSLERLARPYLDAAFRLVAGSPAVVLDLRGNGGGEPSALARIAGWVLGPQAQHLSDVRSTDGVRQWWTDERAADEHLPAGTAVAVLVGARTYSSGEALAYHLQQRGVPVVGERTPGAADHVVPIRLAPTVTSLLPHAVVADAVAGGNWEGTGVQPDVRVGAEDALDAAVDHLLAATSIALPVVDA